MHFSIIVALGLTGLVLAAPAPNKATSTWTSISTPASTCKAQTSRDANFDDLTGVPGVELNQLPVPYMGLYFQGFQYLIVVKTNVAPGVVPHSGTNYAFSNSLTTTTSGSAEWTTDYANSAVKSFDLKSFYYGCGLNLGQGATAAPTACNIAITGFSKGDDTAEAKQVVAQEFSYNPSTSLGVQQMAFGTFDPGFKNLNYVLIQYSLPGGMAGLNPDLGLVVDDVIYDTCAA